MTWTAGPDAGSSVVMGEGRHLVGRAPQATVRCDDPTLEPFHAELVLGAGACRPAAGELDAGDADADMAVRQLAGRRPVRRVGGAVEIGCSTLEVIRLRAGTEVDGGGPARPTATPPPGATVVLRPPRMVQQWSPPPIEPPAGIADHDVTADAGGSATLVPAAVALGGAAVVAVVLDQWTFVLFATLGATASAATWVTARLRARRQRRRRIADEVDAAERFALAVAAQRDGWTAWSRASTSTIVAAVAAIERRGPSLWSRRPAHGDAFVVSCGTGRVAWSPVVAPPGLGPLHPLAAATAGDVPLPVDLGPGQRVALCGPHATALLRSLVVQLAALAGPADWQLIATCDEPVGQPWLSSLPHARGDDAALLLPVDGWAVADPPRADADSPPRHRLVVTDQVDQLAVRTGALRRLLGTHPEPALLVVVAPGRQVPAVCTTVLTTTSDARVRVDDLLHGRPPVEGRLAGAGARAARSLAAVIAPLIDPEDPRAAERAIPDAVSLGELLAVTGVDATDAASVAAAWREAGADGAPCTPLGMAADGVVDVDLVRDGPHALLAGTTGSGKSELLRSLVLGLACRLGPDQLTFVLVDYKGGATFDALDALPHVVGVVTDLEAGLADRALRSLRAELGVRERLMRTHGVADLAGLRARTGRPDPPRLVVVVDEFAALAAERPEFLHALVGVAQRGRSLGVHLLLATQRPGGVISDDIRANTNLRLALRLHDAADSVDVVGDPAAAGLPRGRPGRAVLRLGPDELITFQTAHTGDAAVTAAAVAAIREAALELGIAEPRPPWCPPLPERLAPAEVPGGALGIVDLPDEQTRALLRWSPADGDLVVAGAVGSGVSSTLQLLAAASLGEPDRDRDRDRDRDIVLFVVDAGGDARWEALGAHPRCAGVVRLGERERLARLLGRVAAGADAPAPVLVVIDGLAALRQHLEPAEHAAELVLLERILAGVAGTTLLLGAHGAAGVPSAVVARVAHRWVLHLHDRHDAAAFGVPPGDAPPDVPGRIAIAGSGRSAQLVTALPLRAAPRRAPRVEQVGVLPERVGAAGLPGSTWDGHTWRATIGVEFAGLGAAVLDVPDGEHVLVVGPARTGRSHALVRLMECWAEAVPDGRRVVVSPRRSPVALAARSADLAPTGRGAPSLAAALDRVDEHVATGRPVLLGVDDAELVDDPSGRLASLVTARPPGLVVVAAGRPDALRQAYGHWTAGVRRSRTGLVMTGCTETDADLLEATLPRHLPIPPRPGLALMVGVDGATLVQVASTAAACADRDLVS